MTITTAAKFPTAATNSGGAGVIWSSPTNIDASDNVYATAPLTSVNTFSRFLLASGFGLAVPVNSTINGYTVTVEGLVNSATTSYQVQLAPGGTAGGTTKSLTLTTSETVFTLGGVADTWGSTLTPTQLNDPTFTLSMKAFWLSSSQTVSIDAVTLAVTYTPFGTTKTVTASVTLTAAKKRGISQHRVTSFTLSASKKRGIGKHLSTSMTLSSTVRKGFAKMLRSGVVLTASLPFLRASAARLNLKRYRVWVWVEKNLVEDEWTE